MVALPRRGRRCRVCPVRYQHDRHFVARAERRRVEHECRVADVLVGVGARWRRDRDRRGARLLARDVADGKHDRGVWPHATAVSSTAPILIDWDRETKFHRPVSPS